jgi:hypothetical protein
VSLTPGTRVGSYQISAALGAGGMGEVYRARDSKLDREVAIKVLPESFALDVDRVARFTREAKTLATLNHPNIAAIYGIEEQDSIRALVIELVDGEDLSQVITRGPMPLADALPIAKQIAAALEAAHDAGIIHRDLKPANIKVKLDGTVKVLDFGLAKAVEPAESSPAMVANSPTLTARATQMGVILGTAAYMAPEQARGRAVDRRADIWAFGAILYEMVTGRRTFEGDDISITLASVLKDDIDWTALPPATPPALRRVLKRCLQKDPRTRLRDAGDGRFEIDEILSGPGSESAAPAGRAPRRSSVWFAGTAVALIVVAALAAATAWQLKPAGPGVPLRKFSIRAKDGTDIFNAVMSPDGRSVAFLVGDKLWVRRLDTLDAQEIPGAAEVHSLFWSADSTMVGFQAKTQLWKVPATGGNPVPICRVPREFSHSGGAIWLPDDRIVFTTGGSGLMEVSALGGEPRILLAPDLKQETDFHQVAALPGGRGFLFVPHTINGPMASIDLFDGAARRTVLKLSDEGDISFPIYSPSGHLVYEFNGSIWAAPFAIDRGATTGAPFRVAASGGHPSVADDSTLSIISGQTGQENLEPAWVNSKGEPLEIVGRKGHPLAGLRLSPNAREAVGAAMNAPGSSDLWIVDLARHTERRLTYEPGFNLYPSWSRDGKSIVYECASKICSRPADGSGQPLVLVPAPAAWPELSPDNTVLLFAREQPVTSRDIFQVALGSAGVTAPPVGQPKPFIAYERIQFLATVSPTGKYAAYWSNETGVSLVYLTEFPSGRGKWQIGPGQMPRWSPKGDRLYYNVGDSLTTVDVTTTPALSLSEPHTVLPGAAGIIIPGYGFEPSADGSRFLVNRSATFGANTSVTIVQNWFAEFSGKGRAKP